MKIDVSKINPNPFTTRPEIEGTFGVVASTHWIATAVGMATLEKGGNAFDAASRPLSRCKWSSRILMAPAATFRSFSTTSSANGRR